MAIKLIVPPVVEPVSLADARTQCRYDGTENDTFLSSLIIAAREQAEHETGRALITQTRELVADSFAGYLLLRGSPIQSIVSVKYIDSDGAEQTMPSTDYVLDSDNEPGKLIPAYGKGWPNIRVQESAVRVRYICGYLTANDVPAGIKQWILLAVAGFDAQREAIGNSQSFLLPDRFWHRLLDPYRLYEA